MNAPERLETVAVCVDGSEVSTHAAARGFALLLPAEHVVIVTVIEDVDPSLVTGSGFAGGVMSEGEFDAMTKETESEGRAIVESAARELNLPTAELGVLRGAPGPMLCAFAKDSGARALVVGSRGRGGVKRALLGSVSDHVVRNAPCPVVVVGPEA
jgi:nucleotide-binding universal stress UspA family protein